MNGIARQATEAEVRVLARSVHLVGRGDDLETAATVEGRLHRSPRQPHLLARCRRATNRLRKQGSAQTAATVRGAHAQSSHSVPGVAITPRSRLAGDRDHADPLARFAVERLQVESVLPMVAGVAAPRLIILIRSEQREPQSDYRADIHSVDAEDLVRSRVG